MVIQITTAVKRKKKLLGWGVKVFGIVMGRLIAETDSSTQILLGPSSDPVNQSRATRPKICRPIVKPFRPGADNAGECLDLGAIRKPIFSISTR